MGASLAKGSFKDSEGVCLRWKNWQFSNEDRPYPLEKTISPSKFARSTQDHSWLIDLIKVKRLKNNIFGLFRYL